MKSNHLIDSSTNQTINKFVFFIVLGLYSFKLHVLYQIQFEVFAKQNQNNSNLLHMSEFVQWGVIIH